MHIRPATLDDAEALHALGARLALDHVPSREAALMQLQAVLESASSAALVAELDGATVAYALGGLLPMPLYGGPMALLQELYVDEPHRRQRIGEQLVEAFASWAAERGAVTVAVATSRDGARALYESRGFVTRPTWYFWRTPPC